MDRKSTDNNDNDTKFDNHHAWAVRQLKKLHDSTHAGVTTLKKLLLKRQGHKMSQRRRSAVREVEPADIGCEACAAAKTERKHPNKNNETGANTRWTGDVAGPYPRTRLGNRYAYFWVGPDSWSEVGFGHSKAGVKDYTQNNAKLWDNECQQGFKIAKTDRGGEYTSTEFEEWFAKAGHPARADRPQLLCGPCGDKNQDGEANGKGVYECSSRQQQSALPVGRGLRLRQRRHPDAALHSCGNQR